MFANTPGSKWDNQRTFQSFQASRFLAASAKVSCESTAQETCIECRIASSVFSLYTYYMKGHNVCYVSYVRAFVA
jgi:hypothetical protein